MKIKHLKRREGSVHMECYANICLTFYRSQNWLSWSTCLPCMWPAFYAQLGITSKGRLEKTAKLSSQKATKAATDGLKVPSKNIVNIYYTDTVLQLTKKKHEFRHTT